MMPIVNFLLDFLGDPRTISVVALGIALFSAVRTFALQKDLVPLQKEIAEHQVRMLREFQETDSTPVVNVFMRHIGGSIYQMVIGNTGSVPVVDVNLEIIDRPGHESPLNSNDVSEKLPIKSLAPGDECPLVAGCGNGHWPPFDVKLSWGDDSGRPYVAEKRVYGA